MTRPFSFAFFYFFSMVFALSANANDYSVQGSIDQIIDVKGVKTIYILCYCISGFERKNSTNNELRLKVAGTQDSIGYHGSQNVPNEVSTELLSFKEIRTGSFLELESREYTFIHHAYLIDSIEITAPESIKILLLRIGRQELEGRNIN